MIEKRNYKMKRIELGQWILEYDRIETIESYNKSKNVNEKCDCISCKNYYYSSINFNNNIKQFFENFGIDSKKPIEVYD
jgi:hypothetical protein